MLLLIVIEENQSNKTRGFDSEKGHAGRKTAALSFSIFIIQSGLPSEVVTQIEGVVFLFKYSKKSLIGVSSILDFSLFKTKPS